MIDLMRLPGPRQAIVGAVSHAEQGGVLVTSTDPYQQTIDAALRSELTECGFKVVTMGPSLSLADAKAALGVDTMTLMSPDKLLACEGLDRVVLKIDPGSKMWTDLSLALLRRLGPKSGASAVKLWLTGYDSLPQGVAADKARVVTWRGHVSQADVRMFAADRFMNARGPGGTFYWEVLATELAGPDLLLIERMAADASGLLDPIQWLKRQEHDPHPTVLFGDRPFVSPISLVRDPSQEARIELDARIWSAQMPVFFPALERERSRFLLPFKKQIEEYILKSGIPAHRRPERIPEDVEYVEAHHALKDLPRIGDLSKAMVRVCWFMRNQLAHGDSIEPLVLQRFLDLAPSQFKGAWARATPATIAA